MKVTIPERVRTGISFGSGDRSALSATATYQRLERVLTSSTPHGGWRSFVLENVHISVTMAAGLCACLSACAYTRNLSTHLLVCPEWADRCQIRGYITWHANNLAVVQGFVTIVYSIGLALVICSVRSTAESAIWALLAHEPLSIRQIETYLSIARGQVFSASPAIHMMKSARAATSILLLLLIIVALLVVAPLIGWAFAIADISYDFHAVYNSGGSIPHNFVQTNPPTSIDIDALVEYRSWSKQIIDEPMPDYRYWLVNRTVIQDFSNIKAYAMRTSINISCQGHSVVGYNVSGPDKVSFATKLSEHGSDERYLNSSGNVEVQIPKSNPSFTVWVDDFNFLTPNKSSASLVFASFNETIEGGRQSQISGGPLVRPISVSTISCMVEVDIFNDTLQIGRGTPQQEIVPVLSSINDMSNSTRNSTMSSRITDQNEVALWLAVAPVLVGPSIGNAQPTFYKSKDGLSRVLSEPQISDIPAWNWNISEIENFIKVAVGAVALSSSRKSKDGDSRTIISVRAITRKMHAGRVVFMLVPVGVVLATGVVLLCLNVRLHRQHKIPIMRLPPISELLKSSQTAFLSKVLAKDVAGADELCSIGEVRVKFGVARGVRDGEDEFVAGLSSEVEPFQGMEGMAMRRLSRPGSRQEQEQEQDQDQHA